ncbi:MAG: hypothetical protein M3Z31_00985 [Pseudomonadota bacterium]|nr:hypothetical protein [Pseudomonadota bacterium]
MMLGRIAAVVTVLLTALPAPAGAAESGPWGEITGERVGRASANRGSTTIRLIDGLAVMERQPRVRVGPHSVTVHWASKRGLRTSDRTLRLDVKACKRYYVNAQFTSAGSSLWQPVVDKVEDIVACGAPSTAEPAARGISGASR